MPRYAHPDTLENGPGHIRATCDRMALISSYAANDSYAVVSGRILADCAMAPADFVFTGSGANRVMTTVAGKSDPAANAAGSGTSMHVAFLDTTTTRVLYVTPAPADVAFAINTPVAFGQIAITALQPVAA
jgi:hypothetical protein